MGIRGRLIIFSTVLLIAVIGAFATLSNRHLDKIIKDFSQSVRKEIDASLRKAGITQVEQLAEATRIALVQNAYDSLKRMAHDIGHRDDRVTRVAVVDDDGILLAHDDSELFGKQAPRALREQCAVAQMTVRSGVRIDGKRSIAFARPVFQQSRRLGTVFLALSLEPLERELARAQELKRSEARANIINTLLVGLLALCVGVLLTILQGTRISRPIRSLAVQANEIAEGNLNARVDITSRDEVGDLGSRFNFMTQKVQDLLLEIREKVTMQKELEVAGVVQSSLIPDSAPIQVEGMTLAGDFKPATQCSGDWWSYYPLADGRMLIIVGDVTHHGVGSAMITAVVKGAINTLLKKTLRRLELSALFEALDRAVSDAAGGRFHMTAFALIYDPLRRTLAGANASHLLPLLYKKAERKLTVLSVPPAKMLGEGDLSDLQIIEHTFEQGDTVILFTDGIIECENASGEQFSRKFHRMIPRLIDLGPDQLRDRLIESALEFSGKSVQDDDITVIVARFT